MDEPSKFAYSTAEDIFLKFLKGLCRLVLSCSNMTVRGNKWRLVSEGILPRKIVRELQTATFDINFDFVAGLEFLVLFIRVSIGFY